MCALPQKRNWNPFSTSGMRKAEVTRLTDDNGVYFEGVAQVSHGGPIYTIWAVFPHEIYITSRKRKENKIVVDILSLSRFVAFFNYKKNLRSNNKRSRVNRCVTYMHTSKSR